MHGSYFYRMRLTHLDITSCVLIYTTMVQQKVHLHMLAALSWN